jgi:hypothetical protein
MFTYTQIFYSYINKHISAAVTLFLGGTYSVWISGGLPAGYPD